MERPVYLDALKRRKENSLVKVITGIRRCGKSYLLFTLYHQYLNSIGVDDNGWLISEADKEGYEEITSKGL